MRNRQYSRRRVTAQSTWKKSAAHTALSASRITRVVDDLARAALVTKTKCSSDGRGNLATLTAAGLARRRAAHEPHLRRVQTRYLHDLPPHDVAVAGKLISLMLDNLHRSLRDAGELEPATSASVTE
jgi:DNA-binding MarR family transcriptional regulator